MNRKVFSMIMLAAFLMADAYAATDKTETASKPEQIVSFFYI